MTYKRARLERRVQFYVCHEVLDLQSRTNEIA